MPGFATAVTCIDGRAILPLMRWVRHQFDVDYVDLITEPGSDGALVAATDARVDQICEAVWVSRRAHFSGIVVVAGHADCAGNPVSVAEHFAHIDAAVARLGARLGDCLIVGAWVDADGTVTEVCRR